MKKLIALLCIIALFLGGKTKQVKMMLKKEMDVYAKKMEFEKAEVIKRKKVRVLKQRIIDS